MTDVTTPVPDSTPIGLLIGGKLYGLNLLSDTAGADAMGLVADAPAPLTILGRLKAIATAIGGTLKVAAVDGGALATAAKQDTALAQNAPYGGRTAMTVGTAITPGRAVEVVATVAGNVALVLADGSTATVPVNVGLSILPYAAKQIATAGTTATATYGSLI